MSSHTRRWFRFLYDEKYGIVFVGQHRHSILSVVHWQASLFFQKLKSKWTNGLSQQIITNGGGGRRPEEIQRIQGQKKRNTF